ncbi:MAG TPA: 4-hydroxy-tetrahydrodipicolinate synthase [Dehalococcoidia bacterium]|nr:4-hydroxy-tetrahydrodipicolinate synthase [Dehalococcoidia bacterium]
MEIGRLLTAMVTPFDANGAVDYAQAKRLALALLDSGSDGVVLAGTTGESPTLSNDEKMRLFVEVKEAVGSRGVVVAGTGTYNTAESVELSREAQRLGADAVLLTCPYYSRPTQEGLYRHFETIARSVSLPCIMYNIPGRTGVNMSAETQVRLSQIENIVGVKEASGDLSQIAQIIENARPGFRVWSGDDQMTLPILGVGGYGVISVVSHLAGGQMREIVRAHLSGNVDEAARTHRRLLPLMTVLMAAAGNPPGVKHALNALGFEVGTPRLPLVGPDEAGGERIMAEVRRQRIDLAVAV